MINCLRHAVGEAATAAVTSHDVALGEVAGAPVGKRGAVPEVGAHSVGFRLGRRVATMDASGSTADQVVAAMTGAAEADVAQVLQTAGGVPS